MKGAHGEERLPVPSYIARPSTITAILSFIMTTMQLCNPAKLRTHGVSIFVPKGQRGTLRPFYESWLGLLHHLPVVSAMFWGAELGNIMSFMEKPDPVRSLSES